MGINDRHYFRDGRYTSSFSPYGPSTWPPVCKYIIFANIAVYLLQIFVTRPATIDDFRGIYGDEFVQAVQVDQGQMLGILPPQIYDSSTPSPSREPISGQLREGQAGSNQSAPRGLSDQQFEDDLYPPGFEEEFAGMLPNVSVVQKLFELDPEKIQQGQLWRVVTCAFCHDRYGIWHILINMLFVYWFGRSLEMMYGSREFLLFYFAAIIISSWAYLMLALWTGDLIPAIGASGAVMAIVVLYAMHFPRERLYIYFLFPVEIRWLVLVYVIYDVHPVLLALSGEHYNDGVGHAAHLGGLVFGYLYWSSGIRLAQFWDKLRLPQFGKSGGAQPKLKVYDGAAKREEKMQDDVDDILKQINEHGIDSLDDEQKRKLEKASKKLKQNE